MTISVLQEKAGANYTNTASNTLTSAALTSNATRGSTMVCYITMAGTTLPTLVQDSASQTYTLRTSAQDTSGPQTTAMYDFVNNQSATQLTVTATWAASTIFTGIWIGEVGDGSTDTVSHAVYQTSNSHYNNHPATTTGAVTSNTMTPTSQPCLIYGLCIESGGTQANTPSADTSAGFTAGATGWQLSGPPNLAISEYQRLTSTAAIAALFTANDATSNYVALGAVYTEFSGGGGGSVSPPGPMPRQIYVMP